ncbi:MAG: hypothetical protein ABEN55_00915 [Bradymonadaceae bacterium]
MSEQSNGRRKAVVDAFREAYRRLELGAPEESEFTGQFLDAWTVLDAERKPGEGFIRASSRLELPGGGVRAYAADGGWNIFELAIDYPETAMQAVEGLRRIADDIRDEDAGRAVALDIYRCVLRVAATEGDEQARADAWQRLCELFGWDELGDAEPDLEQLQDRLDRMRQLEASFQNAMNLAAP